jgi:hypothetical protein
MTSIAQRLEEQYPKSNKGYGVAVTRMRDDMVGDIRFTLYPRPKFTPPGRS